MGNFQIDKCKDIEGLYTITPKLYGDERGYFLETYHSEEFSKAGLDMKFIQDNQSMSRKGVLRGLHFQNKYPQGKLVRVISGEVYDVAVDLRRDSKTFGKWHGNMFYIPEGFAHGFLVLSETAEFTYKCTNYYHPEDEGGIIWNDSTLKIEWPIEKGTDIILSSKDQQLPSYIEWL